MSTTDNRIEALPQGRLGFLIQHTRNAVLGALDGELESLGVTATQYIALMGIACGHADTPGDLGRMLGCDSGAMTRLLDRIEAKGMIRRVRKLDDRRAVQITLTAKGEALTPQLTGASGRVNDKLVTNFSADELALFRVFLERAAANAGADPVR
jgi:DNA-binding MarR family transcriptional regulator